MTYNRISNQVRRTEDALLKASSERSRLWEMILPYMSEEFHDETCYIDEAHGDGPVVVFEDEFNSSEKHRKLRKSSNAFHSFPASSCHYFLGGTMCHDHP